MGCTAECIARLLSACWGHGAAVVLWPLPPALRFVAPYLKTVWNHIPSTRQARKARKRACASTPSRDRLPAYPCHRGRREVPPADSAATCACASTAASPRLRHRSLDLAPRCCRRQASMHRASSAQLHDSLLKL